MREVNATYTKKQKVLRKQEQFYIILDKISNYSKWIIVKRYWSFSSK